jgi:hypothetical protein
MVHMATKGTLMLLVAVLMATPTLAVDKGKVPKPEHEVLRGRVLADVASLAYGAGLGPKWVSFVFAVETPTRRIIPVRIAYGFYKNEQLPPESFWDYSTLYDLDVKRDQKCDTTVEAISYEKNVDEHGSELPATYVLRLIKNAPVNALERETPSPCYVLSFDVSNCHLRTSSLPDRGDVKFFVLACFTCP